MGSEDNQNHQSQSSRGLLRRIDEQELKRILEHHKQWVNTRGTDGPTVGDPADLSGADLAGMNLAGSDLQHINFQGACLSGADLRSTNLYDANLNRAHLIDAKLQDADLRDANLKEAELFLSKQLAGADVAGAQLPGALLKFEGLAIVEQISRNARTIMFSMLLACVYTWLTIATTSDPLLLTNSSSSPLPIIRTEIPIAGFFWVAPLILLALYLYFHIYLQRLWETLADLPAVFPDGTRLDKKAYPWLLNGLVTSHFRRLRDSRPRFSRLQTGLSMLLGWCTVPVTLLLLWLRYLPRHDWLGTTLQVGLTIAAIGCGILFYRAAVATLRRDIEPALSWKQFMISSRGASRGAFVFVMSVLFIGFSFGAIQGIPFGTGHAANLNALDLRLWVPRVMEAMGNSSFADFIEENLSTRPDNWVEKEDDISNLGLIIGARLRNANLAYARARSAFLVKADLRQTNLFGADLKDADLRLANLQDANLNYADLTGARLEGVILKGAKLHGVNLTGYHFDKANLQGINLSGAYLHNISFVGANLQEANLEGAYLQKIRLMGANLKNANFSGVKIDEVSLAGANIQGTQLIDTQGLTRNLIGETTNWILAHFDKNSLSAFGLPLDLQHRVEKKNLSEMSLSGVYFNDANFRNFNFQKSDLHEAHFFHVDLRDADFSQANLQKVEMQGNLSGVNLSGTDLRQAKIKYSDLSRANLQEANLKGAMLVQVDLRNANLAHANLSEIAFVNWTEIEGANLKDTDFRSSHIINARGLTCKQIQEAIIDENTLLPDYLGSCGQ